MTLRAPVRRAEGGHFVKALVGWAVFPAGVGYCLEVSCLLGCSFPGALAGEGRLLPELC